jgi:predicted permease
MYWGTNILMTFGSVKNEKKQIGQVLLSIIFFLLHIAYGVGTLVGLIQMPFKRKGMFHSKEGDRR